MREFFHALEISYRGQICSGWLAAGRARAVDAMQEADPVEHYDVICGRYIRLAGERSHPIPNQHLVQARNKDQDISGLQSYPILSRHLVQGWSPPPLS